MKKNTGRTPDSSCGRRKLPAWAVIVAVAAAVCCAAAAAAVAGVWPGGTEEASGGDGSYLSLLAETEEEAAEVPDDAATYYILGYEEVYYYYLDEAVAAAQEAGEDSMIVLCGSGTLYNSDGSTTLTLPEDVSLLLPYDDDDTELGSQESWEAYENTSLVHNQNWDYCLQPEEYVTYELTLAEGCTFDVYGIISIGGILNADANGPNGATRKDHANLILSESSEMILEDGSVVSVCGYILGDGTLTCRDGSSIYQPIVILDFLGGSYTCAAAGNVAGGLGGVVGADDPISGESYIMPFQRYTLQNIQTDIDMVSGSVMYAYAVLYASSSYNKTIGVMIGDEETPAVITLSEGATVHAEYDEDKTAAYDLVGHVTLDIEGGASLGSLDLTLFGGMFTLGMKDFIFTMPYNYEINLNGEEAVYTICHSLAILPGATLRVGEGAVLNIEQDPDSDLDTIVIVYDGVDDYTCTNSSATYSESHTASAKYSSNSGNNDYPTASQLQEGGFSRCGELIVNGRLNLCEGVTFAGIVQSETEEGVWNEDAMICVDDDVTLSFTSQIGLVSSKYAGATLYTNTALIMDTDGNEIEMEAGRTYCSYGGTYTDESFTFTFYGTASAQSSAVGTEYTKYISQEIKGAWLEASATIVVVDEDGSTLSTRTEGLSFDFTEGYYFTDAALTTPVSSVSTDDTVYALAIVRLESSLAEEDSYYERLDLAVEDASTAGDEIYLLADLAESRAVQETIEVEEDQDLTICLYDTTESEDGSAAIAESYAIEASDTLFRNEGTLTLDLGGGSISVDSSTAAEAILNTGSLTIKTSDSGSTESGSNQISFSGSSSGEIAELGDADSSAAVIRSTGEEAALSVSGVALTETGEGFTAGIVNSSGSVVTSLTGVEITAADGWALCNLGGTVNAISSCSFSGAYGILNQNIASGDGTEDSPYVVEDPAVITAISDTAVAATAQYALLNLGDIGTISGTGSFTAPEYAVYNTYWWYRYGVEDQYVSASEDGLSVTYAYDTENVPEIGAITGSVEISTSSGSYALYNTGSIGTISGSVSITSSSDYALCVDLGGTLDSIEGSVSISAVNYALSVEGERAAARTAVYTTSVGDTENSWSETVSYQVSELGDISGSGVSITASSDYALYLASGAGAVSGTVTISAGGSYAVCLDGESAVAAESFAYEKAGEDGTGSTQTTEYTYAGSSLGAVGGSDEDAVTIEAGVNYAVWCGGTIAGLEEGTVICGTSGSTADTLVYVDSGRPVSLTRVLTCNESGENGTFTTAVEEAWVYDEASPASIGEISNVEISADGSYAIYNCGSIGSISSSTISAAQYAVVNAAEGSFTGTRTLLSCYQGSAAFSTEEARYEDQEAGTSTRAQARIGSIEDCTISTTDSSTVWNQGYIGSITGSTISSGGSGAIVNGPGTSESSTGSLVSCTVEYTVDDTEYTFTAESTEYAYEAPVIETVGQGNTLTGTTQVVWNSGTISTIGGEEPAESEAITTITASSGSAVYNGPGIIAGTGGSDGTTYADAVIALISQVEVCGTTYAIYQDGSSDSSAVITELGDGLIAWTTSTRRTYYAVGYNSVHCEITHISGGYYSHGNGNRAYTFQNVDDQNYEVWDERYEDWDDDYTLSEETVAVTTSSGTELDCYYLILVASDVTVIYVDEDGDIVGTQNEELRESADLTGYYLDEDLTEPAEVSDLSDGITLYALVAARLVSGADEDETVTYYATLSGACEDAWTEGDVVILMADLTDDRAEDGAIEIQAAKDFTVLLYDTDENDSTVSYSVESGDTLFRNAGTLILDLGGGSITVDCSTASEAIYNTGTLTIRTSTGDSTADGSADTITFNGTGSGEIAELGDADSSAAVIRSTGEGASLSVSGVTLIETGDGFTAGIVNSSGSEAASLADVDIEAASGWALYNLGGTVDSISGGEWSGAYGVLNQNISSGEGTADSSYTVVWPASIGTINGTEVSASEKYALLNLGDISTIRGSASFTAPEYAVYNTYWWYRYGVEDQYVSASEDGLAVTYTYDMENVPEIGTITGSVKISTSSGSYALYNTGDIGTISGSVSITSSSDYALCVDLGGSVSSIEGGVSISAGNYALSVEGERAAARTAVYTTSVGDTENSWSETVSYQVSELGDISGSSSSGISVTASSDYALYLASGAGAVSGTVTISAGGSYAVCLDGESAVAAESFAYEKAGEDGTGSTQTTEYTYAGSSLGTVGGSDEDVVTIEAGVNYAVWCGGTMAGLEEGTVICGTSGSTADTLVYVDSGRPVSLTRVLTCDESGESGTFTTAVEEAWEYDEASPASIGEISNVEISADGSYAIYNCGSIGSISSSTISAAQYAVVNAAEGSFTGTRTLLSCYQGSAAFSTEEARYEDQEAGTSTRAQSQIEEIYYCTVSTTGSSTVWNQGYIGSITGSTITSGGSGAIVNGPGTSTEGTGSLVSCTVEYTVDGTEYTFTAESTEYAYEAPVIETIGSGNTITGTTQVVLNRGTIGTIGGSSISNRTAIVASEGTAVYCGPGVIASTGSSDGTVYTDGSEIELITYVEIGGATYAIYLDGSSDSSAAITELAEGLIAWTGSTEDETYTVGFSDSETCSISYISGGDYRHGSGERENTFQDLDSQNFGGWTDEGEWNGNYYVSETTEDVTRTWDGETLAYYYIEANNVSVTLVLVDDSAEVLETREGKILAEDIEKGCYYEDATLSTVKSVIEEGDTVYALAVARLESGGDVAYFELLENAVDASDSEGDTVILMADLTEENGDRALTETVRVEEDQNLTIQMCDTVDGSTVSYSIESEKRFLRNYGTLTLDLGGGSITVENTAADEAIYNEGCLTIENTVGTGGSITFNGVSYAGIDTLGQTDNFAAAVRSTGEGAVLSMSDVSLTMTQTSTTYAAGVVNSFGSEIEKLEGVDITLTYGYVLYNLGGTIESISGGTWSSYYGILNQNVTSGSRTESSPYTTEYEGHIGTISGTDIDVTYFGIENMGTIGTIGGSTSISAYYYAVYNTCLWYRSDSYNQYVSTTENGLNVTYHYESGNVPTIGAITDDVNIYASGYYAVYDEGNIEEISGNSSIEAGSYYSLYIVEGGYVGSIEGNAEITSYKYAIVVEGCRTVARTAVYTTEIGDTDNTYSYTEEDKVSEIGGIAGSTSTGDAGVVISTSSTSTTSSTSQASNHHTMYIAGIVGDIHGRVTISGCYNAVYLDGFDEELVGRYDCTTYSSLEYVYTKGEDGEESSSITTYDTECGCIGMIGGEEGDEVTIEVRQAFAIYSVGGYIEGLGDGTVIRKTSDLKATTKSTLFLIYIGNGRVISYQEALYCDESGEGIADGNYLTRQKETYTFDAENEPCGIGSIDQTVIIPMYELDEESPEEISSVTTSYVLYNAGYIGSITDSVIVGKAYLILNGDDGKGLFDGDYVTWSYYLDDTAFYSISGSSYGTSKTKYSCFYDKVYSSYSRVAATIDVIDGCTIRTTGGSYGIENNGEIGSITNTTIDVSSSYPIRNGQSDSTIIGYEVTSFTVTPETDDDGLITDYSCTVKGSSSYEQAVIDQIGWGNTITSGSNGIINYAVINTIGGEDTTGTGEVTTIVSEDGYGINSRGYETESAGNTYIGLISNVEIGGTEEAIIQGCYSTGYTSTIDELGEGLVAWTTGTDCYAVGIESDDDDYVEINHITGGFYQGGDGTRDSTIEGYIYDISSQYFGSGNEVYGVQMSDGTWDYSYDLSLDTVSIIRTVDDVKGDYYYVSVMGIYVILEWGDLDYTYTPSEYVWDGATMTYEATGGGWTPTESDSGSDTEEEEEAEGLEAGCIRITNGGNYSVVAEVDFDSTNDFSNLSMTYEVYEESEVSTADGEYATLIDDTDTYSDPFSISQLGVSEYVTLQASLSGDPSGEFADGTILGYVTITISEYVEDESGTDAD